MNKLMVTVLSSALLVMLTLGACMQERATNKDGIISEERIRAIDREETYGEVPGELAAIYESLDQLKEEATVIARVNPISHEVVNLEGFPMTHTTVEIDEVMKGELEPDQTIVVVEEGGDGKVVAGDVPVMVEGNPYVLFLVPYEGRYYILGATQGRFIIREDHAFQQTFAEVKLEDYQPQELASFESSVAH